MKLRNLAICAVAAGALAAAPAAEAAPVVLAPAQIEPQAPLNVKALGLVKGARYVVRVRAGNPPTTQSCAAVVASTTHTTFLGAMAVTLAPPTGRLWCNGKTLLRRRAARLHRQDGAALPHQGRRALRRTAR